MKKRILAGLIAAMLLLTVGCKKEDGAKDANSSALTSEISTVDATGEEQSEEGETVSVTKSVADALFDKIEMKDELVLVGSERTAENAYPGITQLSDDYTIYVNGSGGYAEEIAVIQLKEGADSDALMQLLYDRVDYQKSVFEDYQPREMPKLQYPEIIESDPNLYILVLADNTSTVLDVVTSVFLSSN